MNVHRPFFFFFLMLHHIWLKWRNTCFDVRQEDLWCFNTLTTNIKFWRIRLVTCVRSQWDSRTRPHANKGEIHFLFLHRQDGCHSQLLASALTCLFQMCGSYRLQQLALLTLMLTGPPVHWSSPQEFGKCFSEGLTKNRWPHLTS